MNDTSTIRMKNFDFDNDTSENIFSHPYISYIKNERLQGEKEFHSKNYLLEMPCSHASTPQKLNFVMAKLYQNVIHKIVAANALARSRIVTHSNTALVSIKTFLCETYNILFSKNY